MGFGLQSLFSRGPSPLIGVDFSASSVKVVELGVGRQAAMRLERYAIEPIERGAVVDGNVSRHEAVADALLRALRKAGISTKQVAMALPSASVITKRINLPADLTEDEYEMQVETEASQYIPFAIDEVNLDFQVLGAAGNSSDTVEVLLAASRKEKVEDRVMVAEMAGLNATIIDIEPFAARISVDNVIGQLPSGGEGQILAVFDIGQTATRLAVVFNGQTVFEREQPFGGNQLTQEIVRLYGLTVEEAELKKRSGDLPENYQTELLKPFVEQGAIDISRALQLFFSSTPYTKVDRIYLAGGAAVTPGLMEAVAERTSVPTEILSPFQGMEVADSVSEKQMLLDAPALLVSCGLAMRRFDA